MENKLSRRYCYLQQRRKMKGCISGHALLISRLVDIVPFTPDHLQGAYMEEMPDKPSFAWIFDDPRVIMPIPVKGKLHLFDVDLSIEFITEDTTEAELDAIYDPLIV